VRSGVLQRGLLQVRGRQVLYRYAFTYSGFSWDKSKEEKMSLEEEEAGELVLDIKEEKMVDEN
jgi:hypothetical protein